ncbi:MAG: metallo-beta-lactamase family protein [Firmicutes bacterium]|nr:metallo-beta-lactamase family protein [Bacillota bacterium]
MIIKTLVENTSTSEEFNSEHGLCLHIETKKHKLLFDLGASALFVENAKKMNVDLSKVDLVVISHGHYDHGGGLKAFLNVNSKAKIYLNQKAFDKHYANIRGGDKAYIGLDEGLLPNERFIFVDDNIIIDDELELFSSIKGRRLASLGNQDLFMELSSSMVQDDFAHEQNLIIKEDSKTLLVAGCAHNGIVNIIDHLNIANNGSISHVIGGFHLYNRAANTCEDPLLVSQIGEYLKNTDSKYYTCHCTGIEPYKKMKEIMGEKIQYLATGSQLIL